MKNDSVKPGCLSQAPIKKEVLIRVTEQDLRDYMRDCCGICLACGEWSDGGVEPDARAYECDYCGVSAVMGAEQAVISGQILLMGDEGGDDGPANDMKGQG